ncbi:MAG: hypothetical protein WDO73_27365 [Ignavibacteriota bacterium]
MTADQYASAVKDGLPLEQDHPIADATKQVRVIILDQSTTRSAP